VIYLNPFFSPLPCALTPVAVHSPTKSYPSTFLRFGNITDFVKFPAPINPTFTLLFEIALSFIFTLL
jgi:hypothetical protein